MGAPLLFLAYLRSSGVPQRPAGMRATVVRMRDHADNFTRRDAADREFHVRIAAATGNGSLALVVEGLWQQRRGKLWSRRAAMRG